MTRRGTLLALCGALMGCDVQDDYVVRVTTGDTVVEVISNTRVVAHQGATVERVTVAPRRHKKPDP